MARRLCTLALVALTVVTLSAPTALAGCYRDKSLKKHIPYEDKFYNHKPTPLLKEEDLPETFIWCNHTDGNNYCTASWNQHIPRYCGGCWAHATLSMIQDRLKIKKKAKGIDVMLARQVLLNCGKQRGHGEGCNGGDTYDVFKYMTEYGLPDEGCMPYNATDHTKYKKWKYCPAHAQCINCMPAGEGDDYVCWPIKKFIKYYLTSWGVLAKGEHAMKSEIASRGPIVCGAVCPDDFTYNYRGGVYKDTTGETELDHDVEIVGWGVEPDGTKYWLARNSWGAYWGELGFFKLERGVNALQIENGDCWYAEVDNEIEREIEDGELVGSMYGLVDKDSDDDDDHKHRHHDDDDEYDGEDSMARVVEPEEARARLEAAKLRSRKVIAST